MTIGNNDRKQAFADIVTLEAWHETFGSGAQQVDLHVDVVFGTGRLGEEAASPIRFKLEIKQAELVVVVPQMEPVAVDPTSVSRDTPRLSGRMTSTLEKKRSRSFSAKLFGAFGIKGPNGGGAFDLAAASSQQSSEKLELSGAAEVIAVTQSRTGDGHYRWIMTPKMQDTLTGRPWDAIKTPRMKLVDTRTATSASLPPAVRVELTCRREDLLITELTLKDDAHWAALVRREGFRNRMAAAESYIRDRLIGDGLEVGDIDELFSRLTLASVSAMTVPKAP
ncbi:hypothetical protein [Caulobacter radicis]|uniref:hypothetical protein n=1 Tax=Caulobacter radicis TaxID=2172650 RepID=UPI0010578E88|nr:hypothetical protein [Caulobacter radicis]